MKFSKIILNIINWFREKKIRLISYACVVLLLLCVIRMLNILFILCHPNSNYLSDELSVLSDCMVAIPSFICAIIANSLSRSNDRLQNMNIRPKFQVDKAIFSLELYDNTNEYKLYNSYGEKKYLKEVKRKLNSLKGLYPQRGIINLELELTPDTETIIQNISISEVEIKINYIGDDNKHNEYKFSPIPNDLSFKKYKYIAENSKRVIDANGYLNGPNYIIKTDLYPSAETLKSDIFWLKLKNFLDLPRSKDLTINYLEIITNVKVKYEAYAKEKDAKIFVKLLKSDCKPRDGSLLFSKTNRGKFLYDERNIAI